MDTVGATYGTSTPHDSKAIIIEDNIGLFDFLTADDVLTQISKLKIESNISKADAKNIATGEGKDIRHDVLAVLDVIGSMNGEVSRKLQPIMPGTKLQNATSKQIGDYLGFHDGEDMIHIGELLRRSDVNVVLAKKWFQKHISIMGMTGSGKSNLSKIILAALRGWFKDTIIIIDPHGEYVKLGDSITVDNILADTTKVELELVIERVFELVGSSSGKYFHEIMGIAKTSGTIRSKELSKLDSIVEACSDYYMMGASKFKPYVMEAIKTETIISTIQSRIINHKGNAPLVIDLKGVKHLHGETIVGVIAEMILEIGKTGRPIITMIDEVQLYCPQKKKVQSKEAIINLISEGRKFDCGVVIMSQRPAKVDKDMISQCNTQFCLKVKNDNDVKQMRASTEHATREMFKEIQCLEPGEALLSSPWIKRPVFVKVLEYKSNAELTEEENKAWENYFNKYIDEGYPEEEADILTWSRMIEEFPRLVEYDGCLP